MCLQRRGVEGGCDFNIREICKCLNPLDRVKIKRWVLSFVCTLQSPGILKIILMLGPIHRGSDVIGIGLG